jgi:uncharacterized protein YndB with AHSA1/START domain
MKTMETTEALTLSRLIQARRERVFEAWTTPELAQWIGTGQRRVITSKVDLRIGGAYQIEIETADHGTLQFSGVYREIKAPSRVVFTWNLGSCFPEFSGQPTQVTVDLAEQKGGTLVTITHEGLPTAEVCDRHAGGWNVSLDNLEQRV